MKQVHSEEESVTTIAPQQFEDLLNRVKELEAQRSAFAKQALQTEENFPKKESMTTITERRLQSLMKRVEELEAAIAQQSEASEARMQRLEQEVAKLRHDRDELSKIVHSTNKLVHIIGNDQLDDLKTLTTLVRESRHHYRNSKMLFECIRPVFDKMFPNAYKYEIEFDRILGTGPMQLVGPEKPPPKSKR